MNALILLSILLSAALGIARGADLAFGTDAVTGLCTVGSVWWRYAALGAVVLAAVLIGRHCAGKAETVRSRQPLAGVLAFAGAVCFLAAAGAQLAVGLSASECLSFQVLPPTMTQRTSHDASDYASTPYIGISLSPDTPSPSISPPKP